MKSRLTLIALLGIGLPIVHAQNILPGNTLPLKNTYAIEPQDSPEKLLEKAAHVVPTAIQYQALQDEFISFIHFGPNTFTRMEWGDGKEDPRIFDLKTLDTDQWCASMKAAGITKVIFTAKHHDGFVLWQSRYTKQGIMSTGFQGGKGDIMKDLSKSCQKYGLKLGVYLSPADLYQIENPEGLYGNLSKATLRTIPRKIEGRPFANKKTFQFELDDYNEYFLNQLFELLTEYGPIHEVWFDGAHPKTKGGQQYNYPAWRELIHTLAPKAIIFGKEDLRWCGNEAGATRKTEWNVIPFQADPHGLAAHKDMREEDLGSRKQLANAKFLHYQPAETNTSIREGWFYRDDKFQKVRSTDDVFDIYERSVGGNSIFLLNVPPNREGKFSDEDVRVLKEVGDRIRNTYSKNLLLKGKLPFSLIDGKLSSHYSLKQNTGEIILEAAKPILTNRFVIQEAIDKHGERIERFALDAWVDGQWTEVALSSNVGYKRILRFQEIQAKKFRLRILESRAIPVLAEVGAYYAHSRPPELSVYRNASGLISISPKQHDFGWKPHGQNSLENLKANYQIYYSTDGSTPDVKSSKYTGPFTSDAREIKAVAISNDGDRGVVSQKELGLIKKGWTLIEVSSEDPKYKREFLFDENDKTYWKSLSSAGTHSFTLDLGKQEQFSAIAYTPQKQNTKGMLAKGKLLSSLDGKNWETIGIFEFGNLINDPSTRTFRFGKSVQARYLKVEAIEIAGGDNTLSVAEWEVYK